MLKNIIIYIYFYIEHSMIINKQDGYKKIIFATILSLYLLISSFIKINKNEFDMINFTYILIGLSLLIYNLYICFKPSIEKHKNIKKYFGYKNIIEYYQRQG